MAHTSLQGYPLTKSHGYFSPIGKKGPGKSNRLSEHESKTAKNEAAIADDCTQHIQAICTWFESWQKWQQRILFAGLINRLTKAQLRSVSMAVESVFHRDFLASYKEVYPMKKKVSSHKSAGSSVDRTNETPLSNSTKLEIGDSLLSNANKDDKCHVSETELLDANKDNDFHPPDKKQLSVSHSAVIEEKETQRDFDQSELSSSRNLSPIVEQDDVVSPPCATNQHPSAVNSTIAPNISAIINENRSSVNASVGSAHSVAPSLSPIEEKSPESAESSRHGESPAKASPTRGSPSTKMTRKSTPKKIKENQEIIPRPDSMASLWTMGPAESVKDDNECDFHSSITPLHVHCADFFNVTGKQKKLGGFMTIESRAGSAFLTRLDQDRNKVPLPMSHQIYKHSKLWSSQKTQIAAKTSNLKEGFRQQLSQIWNWADGWKEHIYIRLLLQLFDFSDGSFEKYVADCIKQRQMEANLAQITSQLLPDKFWLEVFKSLSLPDLLTAGLVCKHWFHLANNDSLWKTKCEEIGRTYNVPHLVKLIEQTASPNETLDWKQAYIELHQRFHFNADKIAAAIPKPPSVPTDDESASLSDDEAYNQEKYRGYISFSKFKNANTQSTKKLLQKQYLGKGWKYKEEAETFDDEPESLKPDKPADGAMPPQKQPPTGGGGGFLEMWKNITEDLPINDTESISKRSDRCYEVDLWEHLFGEEEMKEMRDRSEAFAVDYRLPMLNRDRYWLVNSVILPVQKVQVLEAHRGAVTCILCNGKRIFSGGLDRRVRIWSDSGECFAKMDTTHKGSVQGIAVGADEKCRKVYTSSWDTNVCVWDSITGKLLGSLVGHTDSVSALAVDAKYVVSCSHDGTVRVWDIRTYKCIHILEHHQGAVHCLSYDDRLIITGGADKMVNVTDPDTGFMIYSFRGHMSPVNAVTRQQNLIASGDMGGEVIFWSLGGDQGPMERVRAHEKQINQIAFHGGRFFTASNDHTVKEWELMTMTCVRVMQGHADAVTGVQFNSRYLVSCSKDSTIRLWWWGSEEDSTKAE